jgi:hypothetical protein
MTFPRISSLMLAIGGAFWAVVLLGFTFKFLQYSAGGLVFLLMWVPGFIAWYGYIRHASRHYLLRQARVTWLVSVVANTWSLFLVQGHGIIPLAWIVLALVISLVCLVKEWGVREPERHMVPNVTGEQFRKLLDEHRKKKS